MTRPDIEGIRGWYENARSVRRLSRMERSVPALLDYIGKQASVVEAARTLIDGYNSRHNKSRAGTVANLRARLAEFDAATLSIQEPEK